MVFKKSAPDAKHDDKLQDAPMIVSGYTEPSENETIDNGWEQSDETEDFNNYTEEY